MDMLHELDLPTPWGWDIVCYHICRHHVKSCKRRDMASDTAPSHCDVLREGGKEQGRFLSDLQV